jgi:hypothetical protein
MPELSRLERLELSSVWTHEAVSFTPWLAQEENLAQLGEAIGIELELEAQEKSVGPFRADILCKDADTDEWVLIENQLERTDHKHLGQLLTYAAGLQTVTIIWIAARFTDEHRAALDWLNQITGSTFRFFGVEIELWRIGSSPPAPRFNIVSKPNDFTQSVGAAARVIQADASSPLRLKQMQYWQQLSSMIESRNSLLRPRAARPQHWTTFGVGRGTGPGPWPGAARARRGRCGPGSGPTRWRTLSGRGRLQRLAEFSGLQGADIGLAFRRPPLGHQAQPLHQRQETRISAHCPGRAGKECQRRPKIRPCGVRKVYQAAPEKCATGRH